MKTDPQEVILLEQQIGSEFLLPVMRTNYSARFVTGRAIYQAETWSTDWQGQVIITLHDARVRDPQGRAFVTEMLKVQTSPRIAVPLETMVTTIARNQAYYVPLPRGCSLYLEKRA